VRARGAREGSEGERCVAVSHCRLWHQPGTLHLCVCVCAQVVGPPSFTNNCMALFQRCWGHGATTSAVIDACALLPPDGTSVLASCRRSPPLPSQPEPVLPQSTCLCFPFPEPLPLQPYPVVVLYRTCVASSLWLCCWVR
jgi:hypothetical protein